MYRGGFRTHSEVLLYLECNHPCRARVITGMTIQVRSATTQALNTALLRMKFQDRIAGPSVKFKTAATGKTPRKVAMAIFHFGRARKGAPGTVNQLSRPVSSSALPAPSVNSTAS